MPIANWSGFVTALRDCWRLDDHRVGDAVRLSILRDGRTLDVNVTLGAGTQ